MGLRPARRFETPKAGNRPEECEDASRVSYPYGVGPARIALCDGASESAFAREWAQIIADAFVHSPLDLDNLDWPSAALWLKPCQEQWDSAVPWDRIPWHGEAKTRAGAMATLLGMTVDLAPSDSGAYQWQAVAVGDCCLFIVRDDDIAVSFPLEESRQFNITPALICSNPANNGELWSHLSQRRGECQPGDMILLASDALACWMFQERESGGRPWETLLALSTDEEWEDWVRARRSERAMRNDDTTLIAIEVE